jgi:hypothetical protein
MGTYKHENSIFYSNYKTKNAISIMFFLLIIFTIIPINLNVNCKIQNL